MRNRPHIVAAGLVLALLGGCEGPRENAGEVADASANATADALGKGPRERLGEVQDRAARDQNRAIEAQADAAEDRADEVRITVDQRADALEQQAAAVRKDAKQTEKALDQQAAAIRAK